MTKKGRVLWFDVAKGYGFLKSDDVSEDIFAHYTRIIGEDGEFKILEQGEKVEFELFYADRPNGSKSAQAKDIRKLSNVAD